MTSYDDERVFRRLTEHLDLSDATERWAVEMELRDELSRAYDEYVEHTEIRPPRFGDLIEVRHRSLRWRLGYRLGRLASRVHADGAARGTM